MPPTMAQLNTAINAPGLNAHGTQKKFNVLPGFGLTMGFTLFYLSAVVLIPFAALVIRTLELSWADFWRLATADRALAAYRLTFGASLIAAVANAVFGTLLAWVLVRYEFPGRRFIDAMVDFPFALPTAVAGLTLANLFAANGWLGRISGAAGHQRRVHAAGRGDCADLCGPAVRGAHAAAGAGEFGTRSGRAAATLGAGRLRTFVSVIAPSLLPAVLTGFALAFARAIGEYGSVVFISGNLPFKTEIAPYLIVMRLEEYDTPGRSRWRWCCW
jgi:sulfate transport system permease protein